MLTKASFSMTRNIRKNIPLVTRVDDNSWTIRGQLPFPQGLHFVYNQFAAKHVADIFSHPFFMEPEYWPEQPSPQFHLTEEMQSCMLVVKGMIHMRDVTTHLDNTMVLCRNPHDHTEFGIYNPSHVEEQTLEHVERLIEGCGVEPETESSSEKFSMSAAYGSGQGVDRKRMNSSLQLPSPSSSRSGGGMGGAAGVGANGNAGGGGGGPTLGRSGPPKMGTVKQVLESERKRKLQNTLHQSSADGSAAGEENQSAHFQRLKKYGHMFEGKKPFEGMVEGDPRLYSDEPWRELANRNPEDQLPPEYREAFLRRQQMENELGGEQKHTSDKELFEMYQKEQEEKKKAAEEAKNKSRRGKLKWIVVPTRQTWQALEIWRSRFPNAIIYCSGNVPAHLTVEGRDRGVKAPTAFSLPTVFTPHEPTPKPHEGTDPSGIMMSGGGHGAKGGASSRASKKNNNNNNQEGEEENNGENDKENKSKKEESSVDFLARKFNPISRGSAKGGSVKDMAGKWHKPQIDLTRSKIEFFEKEAHDKNLQQYQQEQQEKEKKMNKNNNNENDSTTDQEQGFGEAFNNVSFSADPSSIRRQREYERVKEMNIVEQQQLEKEQNGKNNSNRQQQQPLTLASFIAQEQNRSGGNTSNNNNLLTSSTSVPSSYSQTAAALTSSSSISVPSSSNNTGSSFSTATSLITDLDFESQQHDMHQVPQETIQVPKSDQELAAQQQRQDDNQAQGQGASGEEDNEDENPYELLSNPTPIEGVQILPRDGTITQLFGGAFNLIRVTGDPRTNEFVLYQKDSGLLACTDLFHGSYTDYDPMNTWLVRVWGKFQRGGLYKDAGLLPAFRLNQLKSYSGDGAGLPRIQKFVDDLTRGLAEKMKILVYAHGTGPMIVPTDLISKQQMFEERMAKKQQLARDRESTQLLKSMLNTNVDGSTVNDQQQLQLQQNQHQQENPSSSSSASDSAATSVYTKTYVADSLRAQYGLASLDEGYEAVAIFGLKHPVTLGDLNRLRNKAIEDHNNSLSEEEKQQQQLKNETENLSQFVSDYRHQQHDGVVRHRPPPKEFTDQENLSEDEVMRTQYVRPKF
jgi:hypothetical protein